MPLLSGDGEDEVFVGGGRAELAGYGERFDACAAASLFA